MINWNYKYQFPADSCFANRCTGIEFTVSKASGNPMVALELEVVSPDTYDVAGELINIAGVKTINYYTITVYKGKDTIDEEKTEDSRKRFCELMTLLFPTDPDRADKTKIDWDNPKIADIKGLVVLTQMGSEEREQRKTPTSAQIAEAKEKGIRPEGDIMKHPITGKPIVGYSAKVREIFGLAPSDIANKSTANKPF